MFNYDKNFSWNQAKTVILSFFGNEKQSFSKVIENKILNWLVLLMNAK